jgi:hypothetical protein
MFENHRHRLMPLLYVIAGILLTLGAISVLNYVHLIPAIPGLPRVGSETHTNVDPQTLQSHLVAQNKQVVYTKEYDQGVTFNQSNTPEGPFKDFIQRFGTLTPPLPPTARSMFRSTTPRPKPPRAPMAPSS